MLSPIFNGEKSDGFFSLGVGGSQRQLGDSQAGMKHNPEKRSQPAERRRRTGRRVILIPLNNPVIHIMGQDQKPSREGERNKITSIQGDRQNIQRDERTIKNFSELIDGFESFLPVVGIIMHPNEDGFAGPEAYKVR